MNAIILVVVLLAVILLAVVLRLRSRLRDEEEMHDVARADLRLLRRVELDAANRKMYIEHLLERLEE